MAQQDKHFSSFSTTHFSIWGIDETKLPSKDCAAPPSIPILARNNINQLAAIEASGTTKV
ncbi:hypothetical protein QQP08_001423 [Theobroma cacao]|nr:hypothetical protein QQP08_001423 [Theobroma cacao]